MPLSPVTRALRSTLLLAALTMAVLALAFAVAPKGAAVGSLSDTAADGPAGSAAGTAPGAIAGTATGAPGASAVRGKGIGITRSGVVVLGAASDGTADAPESAARPPEEPVPVSIGDPAAATGGRMYIGSVAGGYEQALAGTGVPLADHAYAFFTSTVPQAEMITVSAGGTKWRDVAAAGPGSALYGQIVAWAQTIKARGETVMLAYNHEPEAHDRLTLGNAADFVAAWRHVRTIFDQQGAHNIIWTWQMTAYAFRVDPSSEQHAARWYPGDDWVDNVGADSYNWYSCGANAPNPYVELQAIGDPVLAFARAHGKRASFPEFASHANPNRTQWLANAHRYLVAHSDVLTAAFYFNRPPTIAANADCRWGLTTASEYGALREMAQDTAHFVV